MARAKASLVVNRTENSDVWTPAEASLTLTTDLATTAVVNVGGRCTGRIRNRSGGALTLTFYEADSQEGEAALCRDEDGGSCAKTLADNESWPIPSGIAGVEWLVILSSGAAAAGLVTMVIWR